MRSQNESRLRTLCIQPSPHVEVRTDTIGPFWGARTLELRTKYTQVIDLLKISEISNQFMSKFNRKIL